MNTRTLEWSWYHWRFWFAKTSGLKLERRHSSFELLPHFQALWTWVFNLWKLLLRLWPINISLWARLWPRPWPGPNLGILFTLELPELPEYTLCKASPATLNASSDNCCSIQIGDEGRSSSSLLSILTIKLVMIF